MTRGKFRILKIQRVMKIIKESIILGTVLCLFGGSLNQSVAAPVADAAENAFNRVPSKWKWISPQEVIFTYDGTYTDSTAFVFNARTGQTEHGVSAPEKFSDFPVHPEGAVNMTYSPDSTKIAYTRDNDLYVTDIASGREVRLTTDGSELILNGYASWVYYEEILGRPSKYRAFWWSPDGTKIGFYRFDNTQVPLFPIYSPFGQDGSLRNTRYPKAGERNPEVKIGIADVAAAFASAQPDIVWADFNPEEEQYFGIPFWGADSKGFFISRMPRLQNTLDLYRVDALDGSKTHVYHEEYKTWLDWIDGIVFKDNGLYMARRFETGWEQIYFLSYDGKTFRRLTDGRNWDISILRVDERKGDVYFTARRDATVRQAVYKVDSKGVVTALTDPVYDVRNVVFSPDGKYFTASCSNSVTPVRVSVFETYRTVPPIPVECLPRPDMEGIAATGPAAGDVAAARTSDTALQGLVRSGRHCREHVVADMAYEGFSPEDHALPRIIYLTTSDGLVIPASVTWPEDFNPEEKYPVHFDIYGGPDTPVVRDRWITPNSNSRWWSENGIIEVTADCRASGHNGREGLDMIYRQLTVHEVQDFVEWAEYFQSLPYVRPDKIGVEGFSFGGTMTSMLLMQAPEHFHYGVAGGGVYDWSLYDSHYTERYMDTPQNNPEGYKAACALNYVDGYPAEYSGKQEGVRSAAAGSCNPCTESVMLKLTHGTGDDNVHFQNTLQFIDALQKSGKKFDFMIYPDGMHGYRGAQQEHFISANREFWLRYLKDECPEK